MSHFIGIDIGSTCAKTVVMDQDENIVFHELQPTGWSSIDTAEAIEKQLAEKQFAPSDGNVVATGYGRISVPYADKCVTEISCHANGACHIFENPNLTVIDIGGQDTKIIEVRDGMVTDFIMNDKCSAGTGRFLEVMANTLSVKPDQLCEMAAQGGDTSISSMCTVFAESEVISLIGRGESRENIAFAVVDSIVKKVLSQVSRLQIAGSTVVMTGGLSGFTNLRESLAKQLGNEVKYSELGHYAGAIGAALYARKL